MKGFGASTTRRTELKFSVEDLLFEFCDLFGKDFSINPRARSANAPPDIGLVWGNCSQTSKIRRVPHSFFLCSAAPLAPQAPAEEIFRPEEIFGPKARYTGKMEENKERRKGEERKGRGRKIRQMRGGREKEEGKGKREKKGINKRKGK